jgi:hypothetical protein
VCSVGAVEETLLPRESGVIHTNIDIILYGLPAVMSALSATRLLLHSDNSAVLAPCREDKGELSIQYTVFLQYLIPYLDTGGRLPR